MLSLTKSWALGAAFTVILGGAGGIVLAQDKETVLKNRQATMKEQSADLQNVKAYIDGKGDLDKAKKSAADLTQTTAKIPDLFPPGTAGPNPTGEYIAKPVIWTDWNKFLEAQRTTALKANALVVALNGSDKAA